MCFFFSSLYVTTQEWKKKKTLQITSINPMKMKSPYVCTFIYIFFFTLLQKWLRRCEQHEANTLENVCAFSYFECICPSSQINFKYETKKKEKEEKISRSIELVILHFSVLWWFQRFWNVKISYYLMVDRVVVMSKTHD